MNITEIISKAKSLDQSGNCNEVVLLLEEYINNNRDNKMLIALYEKNVGLKAFVDNNWDAKKLYEDESINRYTDIPEDKVLEMAEIIFRQEIADYYVSNIASNGNKKSTYAYLLYGILSLGKRMEDYIYLEAVLNNFREIMYFYDLSENFYVSLVVIVDWRSKVSENILHYLVKKAKQALNIATYKDLYNSYIKNMSNNIFPFEEKPRISEGKVVLENIKTQEAKDFWKGYFAYVKDVREKEYETYKSIISNKKHEFHEEVYIGKAIKRMWNQAFLDRKATPEELVKMSSNTDCCNIEQTDETYKARIDEADRLYKNVKINFINQIKILLKNLLEKK